MAKRSKAYEAAAAKIDAEKFYAPFEAVTLAKDTNPSKFDATVEVAFRLGVDPRKADQMVRGTVNLPHGTGKTARVLVFATGDKAEAAIAAGADFVGSDDLIEKIAAGWTDFDAAVATPDLMGKVGRLGKVSFDAIKLAENYAAALEEVLRLKPSASKGRYIQKATVATTFGPGISVDPNVTKVLTEA